MYNGYQRKYFTEWYQNTYANGIKRVFLCYDDEKYVGYCYFDLKNGNVSLNMEPEFQGMGYGKTFLDLMLYGRYPGRKAVAEIKPTNVRSINLFIKAGFKIEKITDRVTMSRLI